MINSISAINSYNLTTVDTVQSVSGVSSSSLLMTLANDFYSTMLMIAGDGDALTQTGLNNIKQTFKNENFSDANVYKFLEKLSQGFANLSSDGRVISNSDFLDLFSDIEFNIKNDVRGFSFANEIALLILSNDNDVTALVDFLNQLSDSTLEKIGTKQRFSEARGERKYDVMQNDPEKIVSEQIRFGMSIDVAI